MKIFVYDKHLHDRNKEGLIAICKAAGISLTFSPFLCDLEPYDVVYSPSTRLDPAVWPRKLFLFGPHFGIYPSVFPMINAINNTHKNAVYLQPSPWVRDLFQPHVHLPVVAFPFPPCLDKIKARDSPTVDTRQVFVYCKMRNPDHYTFILEQLRKHDYDPVPIIYGSYKQEKYLELLQTSRFGVWVGCHESQGFALEEALASNCPLLVWDVSSLSDQYNGGRPNVPATTTAYWSSECGERFTSTDQFEASLTRFETRLLTNDFAPRAFVERTLGVEACMRRFLELVQSSKAL